jgi:copper chaperone CopZ
MAEKIFTVPNISCGHCVETIQREVGELPGVTAVVADQASKRVTLTWDDGATDWAAVVALLDEIQYPVADDER